MRLSMLKNNLMKKRFKKIIRPWRFIFLLLLALNFGQVYSASISLKIPYEDFKFENNELQYYGNTAFNLATSKNKKEFWSNDQYHSLTTTNDGFIIDQFIIDQERWIKPDNGDISGTQVSFEYDKSGNLLKVLECSKRPGENKCSYLDQSFCEEISTFDADQEVQENLKACNNVLTKISSIYSKTHIPFSNMIINSTNARSAMAARMKNRKIKELKFMEESGIDKVRNGLREIIRDQDKCRMVKRYFSKKNNSSPVQSGKSSSQ